MMDEDLQPVHCFKDERLDEEIRASCCTRAASSAHAPGGHCAVLGGVTGTLRIVPFDGKAQITTWYGHGGAINELCANPMYPDVFLSGSEDRSIRLWSLRAGGCLAVFGGGIRGHRDQVLSIDWSQDGITFVTGGVDGRVMIWRVPETIIAFLLGSLETLQGHPRWFASDRDGTTPLCVDAPIWSSSPDLPLHAGYVDSVRWCAAGDSDAGPCILSKSVDDSNLVLWRPHLESYDSQTGVHSGRPQLVINRTVPLQASKGPTRIVMDDARQMVGWGNDVGHVLLCSISHLLRHSPRDDDEPWVLSDDGVPRLPIQSMVLHGDFVFSVGQDGYIRKWRSAVRKDTTMPERTDASTGVG